MNRAHTERACSMRLQADMSESFLAEAVSHASYLVNRSPSTVVNLHILEEIWQGESKIFNLMDIRLPNIQLG